MFTDKLKNSRTQKLMNSQTQELTNSKDSSRFPDCQYTARRVSQIVSTVKP